MTTFAGSVAAIFLAQALLKNFSGKGLVPDALTTSPEFVIAVAIGAGATVILAALLGFPISTTHGLTGALVGAGLVAAGSQMNFAALGKTFVAPLLLSPLLAMALGGGLYLLFRSARLRLGVTKEIGRGGGGDGGGWFAQCAEGCRHHEPQDYRDESRPGFCRQSFDRAAGDDGEFQRIAGQHDARERWLAAGHGNRDPTDEMEASPGRTGLMGGDAASRRIAGRCNLPGDPMNRFEQAVSELRRGKTEILQINVG